MVFLLGLKFEYINITQLGWGLQQRKIFQQFNKVIPLWQSPSDDKKPDRDVIVLIIPILTES